MPQIVKLVPVDGKLGIVLDIPLEQLGIGSVSIYTAAEMDELEERLKRAAQGEILERIAARIANNRCPQCFGWGCAKEIAATVRGEISGK